MIERGVYERARRSTKAIEATIQFGDRALTERLLGLVEPEPNSGCWLFVGSLHQNGYGYFSIDHHPVRPHRISYRLFRGPIPDGLQIDHLCRTLTCVNPAHLEPVTPRENNRRAYVSRGAFCRRGHPRDLYTDCRICRRQRKRATA